MRPINHSRLPPLDPASSELDCKNSLLSLELVPQQHQQQPNRARITAAARTQKAPSFSTLTDAGVGKNRQPADAHIRLNAMPLLCTSSPQWLAADSPHMGEMRPTAVRLASLNATLGATSSSRGAQRRAVCSCVLCVCSRTYRREATTRPPQGQQPKQVTSLLSLRD